MDLRWRGYLAKMPASVSLATQGLMSGVTKIQGEHAGAVRQGAI
jgi:hypothetical protein